MRLARNLGSVVLVIAAVGALYELVLAYPFLERKVNGRATPCSWWSAVRGSRNAARFRTLQQDVGLMIRLKSADSSLGIVHVTSPERDFWVRRDGWEFSGKQLLAYLLAGQQWLAELRTHAGVRRGDVVLDCGAHVGVFTRWALMHGAARVLAV